MRRILSYCVCLILFGILASCSALPGGNLTSNYLKSVRDGLDLFPVYPPREEFQVGDVYYVEFDPNKLNDLGAQNRAWLGHLPVVIQEANKYMASRIVYADSEIKSDAFSIKPSQTDIAGGEVAINGTSRTTLPIVSFPSISGRASTAGALGGYGLLRSFGFGFGSNETVSLDFGDTRAFGMGEGEVGLKHAIGPQFKNRICPVLSDFVRPVKIKNTHKASMIPKDSGNRREYNFEADCEPGKKCLVTVVSRTYLTRTISYNYTSAQISRFALSRLRDPSTSDGKTLAIPGNLDVNVSIGPDADGKQLDQLIAGISSNLSQSRIEGQETDGLSFVGVVGRGLEFKRTFRKPVAIAYEALADDPANFYKKYCTPNSTAASIVKK